MAADIQEFTTRSGLTLPKSAQPTDWYASRGMDDALYLRVRLSASDLQQFLGQPLLKGLKLSTDAPNIAHYFSVFGPTLSEYRAGQQVLPNVRFVNVMLDERDPEAAIVYLMWGET